MGPKSSPLVKVKPVLLFQGIAVNNNIIFVHKLKTNIQLKYCTKVVVRFCMCSMNAVQPSKWLVTHSSNRYFLFVSLLLTRWLLRARPLRLKRAQFSYGCSQNESSTHESLCLRQCLHSHRLRTNSGVTENDLMAL